MQFCSRFGNFLCNAILCKIQLINSKGGGQRNGTASEARHESCTRPLPGHASEAVAQAQSVFAKCVASFGGTFEFDIRINGMTFHVAWANYTDSLSILKCRQLAE